MDDELRAAGAGTPNVINKVWDFTAGFGGPIVQDKLWFYGSYRHYGLHDQPPGAFSAVDPTAIVFVPGEPVRATAWNQSESFRLTWQPTTLNKVSFLFDAAQRCLCDRNVSSIRTFEASGPYTDLDNGLPRLLQGEWNWVATNQVLVEVGQTYRPDAWTLGFQDEIPRDRHGVRDSGTGISSRAPTGVTEQRSHQFNGKASVTYATGSHNLKVGGTWYHGERATVSSTHGDHWFNLRNGVPLSITLRATPYERTENLNMNMGIYAQEQYTVNRLTANVGVRFDYIKASFPAHSVPAVQFVGPRSFAAVEAAPNWKDVSPRLGVVYDVSGDGRTALKAHFGKYLGGEAAGLAASVNPVGLLTTTTRPWTDANMDLVADCDLTNLAANGECGVISNSRFGDPGVPGIRYSDDFITGWGKREYNWESMIGIEHELVPGLSIDASYHRRSYGNFQARHNAALTPADFDSYCITAPIDSRLPGGGGNEICGLFDVKPEKFPLGSDTVLTHADTFGNIEQVFDGVDFYLSARLLNGVVLRGGTSTGRTRVNMCDAVLGHPEITSLTAPGFPPVRGSNAARTEEFCDSSPPMVTQVKFSGVYPLPWWGVQLSGVFQSLRYPQEGGIFGGLTTAGIAASYSVPVADIIPSLGRPLSGGRRSYRVNLVPAGTVWGERIYQFDLRVGKNFSVGDGRVQANLDLYNLFNNNTVLRFSETFGSRWQRPISFLLARMAKFSVQVNF